MTVTRHHGLIVVPRGDFIALHIWQIIGRKNLTVFKSLSLFSILCNGFVKFLENRKKEFKLKLMYFNVPRTGNQMHLGYLNIRSGHEIESAIRGIS